MGSGVGGDSRLKLPSQVSDFQGFSRMVLTLEMITMSAGLRARSARGRTPPLHPVGRGGGTEWTL